MSAGSARQAGAGRRRAGPGSDPNGAPGSARTARRPAGGRREDRQDADRPACTEPAPAVPVTCWHIGAPDTPLEQGAGLIPLAVPADLGDRAAPGGGPAVVLFHEAMADQPLAAGRVEVHVPTYRPNTLVPVLGWLAARLATTDAPVTWRLTNRQGPESLRRLLAGFGWELTKEGGSRQVRLVGAAPPAPGPPPPARTFVADLGGVPTELAADFGVFSPGRVDDGTALLLEVALRHASVATVADVGIGYGPLAVGLVRGGVAASALGTDVDSLALWLAAANARRHGVPLGIACTPDPTGVPPTGLTVCNIPTHLNAADTARLTAGLRARAAHGTLLAVVHTTLADRYARHLDETGRRLRRHPGPAHVVLELPA